MIRHRMSVHLLYEHCIMNGQMLKPHPSKSPLCCEVPNKSSVETVFSCIGANYVICDMKTSTGH